VEDGAPALGVEGLTLLPKKCAKFSNRGR
jgi:hypothetical protein